MNYFEKFTVKGVNVTKANDGSYSLNIDSFEADTQKTTGEILAITGTSLSGTVKQILREAILTAHNKRLNKQ